MIKAKTKKGKTRVKMDGNLNELIVDMFLIIRTAHKTLKSEDEAMADVFLTSLVAGLLDPTSPCRIEGAPDISDIVARLEKAEAGAKNAENEIVVDTPNEGMSASSPPLEVSPEEFLHMKAEDYPPGTAVIVKYD